MKPAATGRVNLHAAAAGVFTVDAATVEAVNAIDPAITIATLADKAAVEPGRMVATVKIIPFAIAGHLVEEACAILAEKPLFEVHPFAALRVAGSGHPREWRVHFHVPIFLGEIEHFSTTQDFLRDILAIHREEPVSAHLEVETYTWDVLPEADRRDDVATAIARELTWVRDRLRA